MSKKMSDSYDDRTSWTEILAEQAKIPPLVKGDQVSFYLEVPDHREMPPLVPRKRGRVVEVRETDPTPVGTIPDYLVTIQGASGKTVTVSLVENYVRKIEYEKNQT
jgi:hypothetical protein